MSVAPIVLPVSHPQEVSAAMLAVAIGCFLLAAACLAVALSIRKEQKP